MHVHISLKVNPVAWYDDLFPRSCLLQRAVFILNHLRGYLHLLCFFASGANGLGSDVSPGRSWMCSLDRIRCALCCHVSPLSLRHQTWGCVEKNIQFIEKKERKERREAMFRGSGNMSSRWEPQSAGSAVPETIVQRMWKSYWRIKLIRRESLVLPCGMNIPYM